MAEVSYLSKEGMDNLKAEIQELKTKGRAEMARQIKEAREKGDLSENAEYDAAKEAQGLLEMRIAKLEELLANARILDESKIDTSKVSVFTTVKLQDIKFKREIKYTLVSEKEADVKSGKISVTSPIGKGLLGKKVGEVVKITVPAGVLEFKILEISM
ncbi:MAG TPA: transcription elongation factor GreA [Chitinophagales bacterium]|nr:transcription elongation factor GreA [Chitinophagales bacterium]HMU70595.1 transcription elongation factor GreA [Chitinophagales bacterium]HMX04432.1 transcription elongation factor GreA [Chitinophagales bacterium]HMZ88276.1 transcription elongation factor GreA [Chitinophagales bacterium]HNE44861.1 transcription elongation factor GreA [Chitinophagales bacterium]